METPAPSPSLESNPRFVLGVYVILWWAANNVYAIDAQDVLTAPNADPFLFVDLTFVQIITGVCIGYFLCLKKGQKFGIQALRRNSHSYSVPMLIVTSAHLIGTALTNASYRSIGATGTLVWKLTEPLVTLVLKIFLLGELTNLVSFMGVQAVFCGVLLFSAKTFTFTDVSPILIANIAFPIRNVILKKNQRERGKSLSFLQRFLAVYGPAAPVAGLALLVKWAFLRRNVVITFQLVKNALLYNTYQFASLVVLEEIDPLTHSLLNTLKRFTGILLAALYTNHVMTASQTVGLAMTFFGFPLHVFGSALSAVLEVRKWGQMTKLVLIFLTLCFSVGIVNLLALSGGSEVYSDFTTDFMPFEDRPENSTGQEIDDFIVSGTIISIKPKYRQLQGGEVRSYDEAKGIDDGGNTGNFVWQHSAYVSLPDFSTSNTCNESIAECHERHMGDPSKLIVSYRPGANYFNAKRALAFSYDIETVRDFNAMPLLVGIGVQAYFTKNSTRVDLYPGRKIETTVEDFEFSEKAKELFRLMEKQKFPMLFRGDFTLGAARIAGYTHGISTGCPSLFLNEEIALGQVLQKKYEDLGKRIGDFSLKIAISIKEGDRFRKLYMSILEKYPNSCIYTQGKGDLIYLEKIGIPYERIRLFNNVEQWKASMREMDVSIGARIHGNMVALGVSVPIFIIAPDHRVLELAQRMRIPHTTFFSRNVPTVSTDIAKYVSEAGFDAAEFDKNRCETAKTFRKVFGKYGIGVAPHVKKISMLC